jgi:hypothetical protein
LKRSQTYPKQRPIVISQIYIISSITSRRQMIQPVRELDS